MMEEQLLNYGVLGIWTIFNLSTILYYRKKDDSNDKDLRQVIQNNTIALTKMYEVMRLCNKNNG